MYAIEIESFRSGLTLHFFQGHDTLQFPSSSSVDVTFRFQSDQFTGHMVQHCHLLFHEDFGMMTQYDITGKEGAIWEYARVCSSRQGWEVFQI